MKILIDLQAAQATNRHRGIGRYTLAITYELVKLASHHEIEIMLSQSFPESLEPLRDFFSDVLPAANIITWKGLNNIAELRHDHAWRMEAAERIRESFIASRQPDIVYVPSVFEGLVDDAVVSVNAYGQSILTAVTVYDLIPWLYPKPYLENVKMRKWYERRLNELKRADLWLAISEASRQDAIQQLSLPEERVINTSCAASSLFQPKIISEDDKQAFFQQFYLQKPFILYTAGIDYRKNIEGLFKAYASLPEAVQNDYQLAIVCQADEEAISTLHEQMRQLGIKKERVVMTGFVSDDDLVTFYNLCTVFVFPSLYEGFGLPALEAMACGTAVIGSNTSSVPEVIGNEAALFNPLDIQSIASKLEEVLINADFRNSLKKHALEQAQKFSWHQSAEKVLEGLERLVKSSMIAYRDERRSPTESERASAALPYKNTSLRNNHRLAYISPLRPEKTGISNYSAELLFELTQHYEIDVIVNQSKVSDSWINTHCHVRSVSWFRKHAHEYEGRILYHMGNSEFHQHMFQLLEEFPGIVVLHDFFVSGILSHLELRQTMPGVWTKALYESHGYQPVVERYQKDANLEKIIFTYPCNFPVLQQASAIITHSLYSYELARQWYGESIKNIQWSHIPHLRLLPRVVTAQMKKEARAKLGLNADDFIVCSFGLTGKLKLNDRLLKAWLDSSLAQDDQCRLIYVGENGGDAFGMWLADQIETAKTACPIKITGFASSEMYQQYLIAADMAVQLRMNSLGETSGAVLDGMGHGLPLIINAHGTMTDIPTECVYFLPDCFSDEELRDALNYLRQHKEIREDLGKKARKYIKEQHNPRKIAQQYAESIEYFVQDRHNQPQRQIKLMQSVVYAAHQEKYSPKKHELLEIAQTLVENEPSYRQKQLLYDVSELVRRDAGSGIQRAVKGYLRELLENPPKGYRVEPVYGDDEKGQYYYARAFTVNFLDCPQANLVDEKVEVFPGDTFLSIDLITSGTEQRKKTYQQWKNQGVSLFFMVYDLLCVLRPEFFPEGAEILFTNWLNMVTSVGAGLICISKTVSEELKIWMQANLANKVPAVYWLHLGADLPKRITRECDSEEEKNFSILLEKMLQHPTLLTVGTIEPRKGHQQTLEAFNNLWKKGIEVNWVIVGRTGWEVKSLVQSLHKHPELDNRLFWFEQTSDKVLRTLYSKVHGCLIASEAEGFGLPLIEAAQYNQPLLVRDIAVFREVAGDYAMYFSGNEPSHIEKAIEKWLESWRAKKLISTANMPYLTWKGSAQQLTKIIVEHEK